MESNETLLSMNLRSAQDPQYWCANISNTNGKEVDHLDALFFPVANLRITWCCNGEVGAQGVPGAVEARTILSLGERENALCHSLGAPSPWGRGMQGGTASTGFPSLEISHCNTGVNWETGEYSEL